MGTSLRGLLLGALCALAVSTTAQAQEGRANQRTGLWGGIGLGYGVLGFLDCDGCDSEGGFSGNARIGGTLSPSLRIAAGTNGWYKDVEGVAVQAGLLSGQVLYYPGAKDFFLLGGAGFAILDCDGCDGENGAGFVIGAGYDIPINRSGSLALTPFLNWIVTTIEATPHFIQFGLGLTFN